MTERATTRIDVIKDWVLAKNEGRTDVAPDEDLIENRLVDSLSFVEFVFLIEETSGVEIDLDSLDINDVRTLDTIEKRFLSH
ncbi:phosphopantetheine-binding protein [Actinosynnema sp. NPDC023658]|uniref:phosphopantetheine-binding protein n=1 Tax=Actinosynnema sp. NPDC023658 TaxID=3155465 RepID=UPI0033C2BFFF